MAPAFSPITDLEKHLSYSSNKIQTRAAKPRSLGHVASGWIGADPSSRMLSRPGTRDYFWAPGRTPPPSAGSLASVISSFNVSSYKHTHRQMDLLIKVNRKKGCRVQTLVLKSHHAMDPAVGPPPTGKQKPASSCDTKTASAAKHNDQVRSTEESRHAC